MKIYSDTAVTKDDLTEVNERQDKQIFWLRLLVGASFISNVALTVLLRFM